VTLKRRWRYLVPAESYIHNHMLIPDYQDNKYQDFRHSDELSTSRKQERKKMDWLQMCAELKDVVVVRTWFQTVALYCQNFAAQHRVAGVTVAATTAVILNQMMDKEWFREWHLRGFEQEYIDFFCEIDMFVQKSRHQASS
nr:hypothetical protein [Tanacetum cinerariifolium]